MQLTINFIHCEFRIYGLHLDHPTELVLGVAVLDAPHSVVQPFRQRPHIPSPIAKGHDLVVVDHLVHRSHH